MPTEIPARDAAIDKAKEALTGLVEAAGDLSKTIPDGSEVGGIMGSIIATPHLDAVRAGQPIMTGDELKAVEQKLEDAKTSQEQAAKVFVALVRIGAAVAREMK